MRYVDVTARRCYGALSFMRGETRLPVVSDEGGRSGNFLGKVPNALVPKDPVQVH